MAERKINPQVVNERWNRFFNQSDPQIGPQMLYELLRDVVRVRAAQIGCGPENIDDVSLEGDRLHTHLLLGYDWRGMYGNYDSYWWQYQEFDPGEQVVSHLELYEVRRNFGKGRQRFHMRMGIQDDLVYSQALDRSFEMVEYPVTVEVAMTSREVGTLAKMVWAAHLKTPDLPREIAATP